jgi:acetyltransferase-like isoleucine patch superfamily enzyme
MPYITFAGRRVNLEPEKIAYALEKGGVAFVRGLLWSVFHGRKPNGLFLGGGVRILASGALKLGSGVSIGAGSYLDCSSVEGVNIASGVTLREGLWLQCRSGLNEKGVGLKIGPRAYIGPKAVLGVGGPISIGEGTQVGAGLTLSAESHEPGETGSYNTGAVQRRGITIGADCWIGNNVTILDGVTIGDKAVIGAGAVVTRSVPSNSKAFGVPAVVRGRA